MSSRKTGGFFVTSKSTNEFSVNVKDMFCSALLRWRLILLAGILFAALGGAYEWRSVRKAAASRNTASQDSHAEEQAAYSANVAAFKKSIAGIRQLIVKDNEYLENSVFMQIDPYAVAKSEGLVTLEVTGHTDAYELQKLAGRYIGAFGSADTQDLIAEENGMEPRYLAELETLSIEDIVVESGGAVTVLSRGNGITEGTDSSKVGDGGAAGTGSGSSAEAAGGEAVQTESDSSAKEMISTVTLRLTIIGMTAEQSGKIYADAMSELEKAGEAIRETQPHKADFAEPVTRIRIDTSILDKQAARLNLCVTYNTNLQNALNQSRVIEKPSGGALSRRISKKKVVMAGAAGVLAMFALLLLLYLLDPRVKSEDDLAQQHGLKKLGACSRVVRQGPFAAIDWYILRSVGGHRDVSDEDAAAMIGINIENFAGSAKKILVTGMAPEDRVRAISEAAASQLLKDGSAIELSAEPNVLDRTEARKELAACDAVLLVESRGKTRYSEVREELRLAADMGRDVIGYVIA